MSFRSSYSHSQSYAYGDVHKCKNPCDCSACCCDHRKDIICDLLQIFLMMIIMELVSAAIVIAAPLVPGRRRKRSLEGLSSYLQINPHSDKFKENVTVVYRVVLGLVTNFMKDDLTISKIGLGTSSSINKINYNMLAYAREPRMFIFFGDDENNPPIPDPCKKKCCLKCCKKDKILCIIQVILLIIIIILLIILIIILLIPGFGRKRRKRSISEKHSLWIQSPGKMRGHNSFNYNFTCDRGTNDIYDLETIDEVALNIRDALSNVVRTRNLSVDLKHVPSKCQTCIQWSVFDLGHEYGPFVVSSAIPKMLQPLILH